MTQDERIQRARCTEPDPVVAALGHLMSVDGRPSEAITVVADDDETGWRNAVELRERLLRRGGFEVRVICPSMVR
jgi:hypothetical protein